MLLILKELSDRGGGRFNELLASFNGISSKTLCSRLRELEREGIVGRRVLAEIPPRVEYVLTDRGRELCEIVVRLDRFSRAKGRSGTLGLKTVVSRRVST